jgi:hypothetical protein
MFHGRWPTVMAETMLDLAVSITETVASPPLGT